MVFNEASTRMKSAKPLSRIKRKMIIPVIGAPGTGKTTICQELTRLYGTPHFEMSWMPEFLRRNGVEISYVEDERIAVQALICVARVYSDAGHNVVCVSDFRNEVLPLVFESLDAYPHRIVRLYSSVETVLEARMLEPTRPSGYRDVVEAKAANREIMAMDIGGSLDIDIAQFGIEDVLAMIRTDILEPNQAI